MKIVNKAPKVINERKRKQQRYQEKYDGVKNRIEQLKAESPMNYLESLYWIHERTKFGIKPGVKRMEWMLDRLNNPQLNIRAYMLVVQMVKAQL